MCLIIFSYNSHNKYKLIFCANRDEFFNRPTENMHFWPENPDILAGRDLLGGGTWLGISKKRKIAALTNFRELIDKPVEKPSRGKIVKYFLCQNKNTTDFFKYLKRTKNEFNFYNLIFGNINELYYYSNKTDNTILLENGIYGISNAFLDTPWQKIVRGKEIFKDIISNDNFSYKDLFWLLTDDKKAEDDMLPNTGYPKAYERELSSIFVKMGEYGTRSSTVILIDYSNNVNVYERCYDKTGCPISTTHFNFSIDF